ncbi:hypothetical protein V499_02187 [Pseudogymnoascus sp. VKM F-103]|nr:hypothetical protein V499_02187 [Pseudogymnoascus sp. VKM F-103]
MTEPRGTGPLSDDPVAASEALTATAEPAATADLPRPPKRRKISSACEPCRARKTRCDGNRPMCGPCQYKPKSQQSCVYARDPTSRNGNGEHDVSTRGLLDRIQSLEHVIASSSWQHARQHEEADPSSPQGMREVGVTTTVSSPNVSTLSASRRPVTISTGPQNLRGDEGPHSVNHLPSPHAAHQSTLSAADVEDSSSPVNAMGSTAFKGGGSTLPLSSVNEFYGGSSAARFMEQVEEAIPGTNQPQSYATRPQANLRRASKPVRRASKPQGLSLPTRDLADTLLENYWAKSHSLYPFVYKPVFTRAYEDLWKPVELHRGQGESRDCDLGLGTPGISDSQSTVYHCALNAIFALSCQLSGPEILQHDRDSLSQTFFLRCRGLLHVDILDHGSIALVQTLLIVAQYLQSTSFSSRCWTSLGLACRIGQGIGLHVETSGFQRDEREVELRRRVWYGCTVMDIVASTTLGRPMMTPSRVTIPLPSISKTSVQEDLDGTSSPFYIETIKLYTILGRIVSTVYSPWSPQLATCDLERNENCSHSQLSESEAVMSFDEELSDFEEGIATCLHWERGISTRNSLRDESQHLLQRQSNVLHARGHPVNHALEGESSTQGTTQSHSSLPELASASAVETQQDLHSMVSDSVRDSPFAADSLHGRHLRNFPGQAIPKDLESSTMQPLLDFMTQDINLMPFGLIDESWWDLDQMANPEMSFDG